MTKEAGSAVKHKLDEKGVTQSVTQTASKIAVGSKLFGGYLADKAKAASNKVTEKIDSNEKLAHARDVTKEKVSVMGKAMSVGFSSMMGKFGYKKQQ